MTGSTIRDATEADLPAIVALMVQLAYPGEGVDVTDGHRRALAQLQATPGQRLLVIEDDAGRVVGATQLMIIPNLSLGGRPRAIVENVCVDAAARGNRYGERLMAYCLAQARAAGCFKLSLTSNRRRVDAHRFYERLGFQVTHTAFSYALADLDTTPAIGGGAGAADG